MVYHTIALKQYNNLLFQLFCVAIIGCQPKPAILAECSALSHFAFATVVSQLHSRTYILAIAVSQLQSHNCIHIWIPTAARTGIRANQGARAIASHM